jgi:hypothetical protein
MEATGIFHTQTVSSPGKEPPVPHNIEQQVLGRKREREDTDPKKTDASNNSSIVAYVFVAPVTILPSRYLATIGDTHIDTQTDGRNL